MGFLTKESPTETVPFENSNGIRLSAREWVVVGVFTLTLVAGAPSLWQKVEQFDPGPDYRVPYELAADYWLYDRYSRLAAARYETLLVGDSVIWGQYVTRDQTLSHYLNALAGRERFANLGLDGAHPAALAGLLEYYGDGIRGKNIVLQCNPLWFSSPDRDLREPDAPLNHPDLVPQFLPRIPNNKAEVSQRIGRVIDRHVPFAAWTNHLQQAYFGQTSIPHWTLEHPYADPLNPLLAGLPAADEKLRHEAVPWTISKQGITKQQFPWVDLETSLQWKSFQRAVAILQQRGNHVFVLVGPFNEHMLQDASRRKYQLIKQTIATWLAEHRIPYTAPTVLPSEFYADASHPLSEGYLLLAKRLAELDFFQERSHRGSGPDER
jgi:hypothetical protein